MPAKTTKPPTCKACGVPFEDHLGIEGTCRKLDRARVALKVLDTWANFKPLELDREQVANLIEQVLEVIK
jgi:hypothetical protein